METIITSPVTLIVAVGFWFALIGLAHLAGSPPRDRHYSTAYRRNRN